MGKRILIQLLLIRHVLVWTVVSVSICRIGTRPSPLALVQANAVAEALQTSNPDLKTTIVPILARGDIKETKNNVVQSKPLAFQSVDFTGALDQALNRGEIDVAVHSFKDIPPDHRWKDSSNFAWVCPLPRENPLDVLVGAPSLQSLVTNKKSPVSKKKIGTSSIRRQAQLHHELLQIGCDETIELVNLRGNIESRLRMLDEGVVDALVLAKAGLERLGKASNQLPTANYDVATLPTDILLPGLCQGIVAAVYSKDFSNEWIIPRDHDATMAASTERAFLNALDESSPWVGRPPLAGLLERQDKNWVFRGLLSTPDGKRVLRTKGSLPQDASELEAQELGTRLGLALNQQAGPDFFSGS